MPSHAARMTCAVSLDNTQVSEQDCAMTHHLVGATEAAEVLGVTRQRIHQLASQPEFPKPEVELTAGKVWRREDVERWMKEHRDEAPGPKALSCSFCGKHLSEVLKLVAGPAPIEICNECIDLAGEIVLDETGGRGLIRVPAYYFRAGVGESVNQAASTRAKR